MRVVPGRERRAPERGRAGARGQAGREALIARALVTVLNRSAFPYGYTATIWSSGALLIHFHGSPSVLEAFLFPAGALAAFTLLSVSGRLGLGDAEPLPEAGDRVLAGVLNWVAVGCAVGSTALLAQIPSTAAWPLATFAGTFLFLATAALELALAERGR